MSSNKKVKVLLQVLVLSLIILSLPNSAEAKKKKGGPGGGGMGGMGGGGGGKHIPLFDYLFVIAFGDKKTQMIFIHIREGFIPREGVEKMAKDF